MRVGGLELGVLRLRGLGLGRLGLGRLGLGRLGLGLGRLGLDLWLGYNGYTMHIYYIMITYSKVRLGLGR